MRFSCAAIFLSLFGCDGPSQATLPVGRSIGTAPLRVATSYGSSWVRDDQVLAVDNFTNRLVTFDIEKMQLLHTVSLPDNGQSKSVVPGKNFNIMVTGADYYLYAGDDEPKKNPEELPGSVVSVAYQGACNRIVMIDDLQTAAILDFDEDGHLSKSAKLGSYVEGDFTLKYADLLPTCDLVVSDGGQRLARVDVEKSIAEKTWQLAPHSLADLQSINLVAHIADSENFIYVTDAMGGAIVDVRDFSIADRWTADGNAARFDGRNGLAHSLYRLSAQPGDKPFTFIYPTIAGKFKRGVVPANVLGLNDDVLQTYFDERSKAFTATWQGASAEGVPSASFLQVRITDGLALFKREITTTGQVALTPRYVFVQNPSGLGSIERHALRKDPEVTRLEGFYFFDASAGN